MKRNSSNLMGMVAFLLLAVQACDEPSTPTAHSGLGFAEFVDKGRYLVVFSAEQIPVGFKDRVRQLGGSVEASLDAIGVVTVAELSDAAARELALEPDIRAVEPDPITTAAEADDETASSDLLAADAAAAFATADVTAAPTTATFFPRQWNLRAVSAPAAWAAGHLGSRDVVVAILDTGIDYLHPDLVGLVDLERSTSFVPEVAPARYAGRLPFSDFYNHGTFVASIVASNGTVVAGINRFVTLLAVKIADSTNATSAGRMLSGILYAADHGADVINLSNGVQRDKSVASGAVAAFQRAANYVFRKGALLVSLPFNDRADLDHNGDLVRFPCEAPNSICVAATGPTGATGITGPWDNVDAPAPYSAFGRSAIDVAAPGGTGMPSSPLFTKIWLPCTSTPTATTARPECRNLSVALSNRVAQSVGTSFAAPHVAGLAALLVAQLGHGNPALIRARILETADDLGEPGTDPHYGKGRINIARALRLTQ
jgi:lantibiotic leader peptide-processing serine protease